MKKNSVYTLLVIAFLGFYTEGVAQVAINTDGSAPSTNTILDLNPAKGKAFIPPTMTWAEIQTIAPVKAGMVVYDSEFNCLRMYNGTKWTSITEQTSLVGPQGSFTTKVESGDIRPQDLTTDAAGNVYMTGYFRNTATFGTLPAMTAAGQYDVFVVKYNNSGTALWVQQASGTDFEEGWGVAVDGSGNVFITGSFNGTTTFGSVGSITSGGFSDIFIAKYNSSGVPQWVRNAGGASGDEARDIALDASGDPYITGSFQGGVGFSDPTTSVYRISAGSRDIFIAKYNSSGAYQWVQIAGGTDADFSYGIAIDGANNIYITGKFSGTATFHAATNIVMTAYGLGDVFVAKYNSSGAVWVQQGGGTGEDYGFRVAVDAANNVYITGNVATTSAFGGTIMASYGSIDAFVVKYNTNGTFQWGKQFGATGNDNGWGIAVDATSNVYVIGYFTGMIAFPTLPNLTGLGSVDVFIVKYNTNGTEQWAQKAGGAGFDWGYTITTTGTNVYAAGTFSPVAQFGNQILTSGSMFLMKYAE